jgi:subtilisin family serine protease
MKAIPHRNSLRVRAQRMLKTAFVLSAIIPSIVYAGAVANQVVVKFKTNASANTTIAALTSSGVITASTQFGTRPIYRLATPNVQTALAQLVANPNVLLAEENFEHRMPEGKPNHFWAVGQPTGYTPTQWFGNVIQLSTAHQFNKGAGVKVAVLDTGIDTTHPALAGKLLPGYNFVEGNNDPTEVCTLNDTKCGHGTHVAGLIALVAPDAKILPYRVLDNNGQGNAWVLKEAIERAIADGASVINLSLGSPDRMKAIASVMKLFSCEPSDASDPLTDFDDASYNADRSRCATNNGVVFVAAAGNDGSDSAKEYPAAESIYGLLAVGASNQATQAASFTNFGSWARVAAPGDTITSAIPLSANPVGYATWNGTSMATPLVAGAAALLRSVAPNVSAKDIARRIEGSGTVRLTTSTGNNTNMRLIDTSVLVQRCSFDVDGDGIVNALTDGLVVARAMMGLSMDVVAAAAAPGSPRRNPDVMSVYLQSTCGLLGAD